MVTMWKNAACQLKRGGYVRMERPDAGSDRQWRTGNNGQQPMSNRQWATANEQQAISGSIEELGPRRPDSTEDGQ